MIIGIPKEVKKFENRVAITPNAVKSLVDSGHTVLVEEDAGIGSTFTNESYQKAGAKIKTEVAEIWEAEMVIKVKEPQPSEYKYFHEGLILFTYLHLANEPELTKELQNKNVKAVAYETMVQDGTLPLLNPMSEVAGRFAVQAGARFLEKPSGGKGILIGSVPGVQSGRVVIIGGGSVGLNAAKMAVGLGARVTIIDLNPQRLAELENIFDGQIDTLMSNPANIQKAVREADIVIGSVLIPGAKAPVLVTEEMIKNMEEGSVVIDIAIDQGGNFETSDHATYHDDPVFIKHGVLHYTVANIPGAVPKTSTIALTNISMLYANLIANEGLEKSALADSTIKSGINVYNGAITNRGVADAVGGTYVPVDEVLK